MKQCAEVLLMEATQHSVLLLEPHVQPRLKPYRASYAEKARKLCSYGLSEIEVADWFDTDVTTITRWKTRHAEFRQAVDVAKAESDSNVALSLYRRAVGYDMPVVHVSTYRGNITKTHYKKHIPPCVTACMFWLKNRQPKQWGGLSETITLD